MSLDQGDIQRYQAAAKAFTASPGEVVERTSDPVILEQYQEAARAIVAHLMSVAEQPDIAARLQKGYSQTTVDPELQPGVTIGSFVLKQFESKYTGEPAPQSSIHIILAKPPGASTYQTYLTYYIHDSHGPHVSIPQLHQFFPSQSQDTTSLFPTWTEVKKQTKDRDSRKYIKRLTPGDADVPGLAEAFIRGLTLYFEEGSRTTGEQQKIDTRFQQQTARLIQAKQALLGNTQ